MKTDETKRPMTGSVYDIIAHKSGTLSRSSSASSFYRSDSEKIDRENNYNLADSPDEIDSAEPASRTIRDWAYTLIDRLSYNCSHFFGLASCLSSPGEDCIERNRPPGKCAEIARSVVTYFLTFVSLATVGTAVMRVSVEGDAFEYPVLPLQSSTYYLVPVGVFVYSFIFSLDRRPSQLIKLFLDLVEVRTILTKEKYPVISVIPIEKELKYEIKLEQENDPLWTTPLLRSKNIRQVRNYIDLKPMEKNQVRKFADLLRKVINPDGPTGQWFYDSNRTGGSKDKWRTMRVYGLFKKNIPTDCDLYLTTRERSCSQRIEKLRQGFSREQDNEILNIISTGSEYIIKKKHLEALYDMTGALIYANKNSYLSPPLGAFTKLVNYNNLFRWSVFLFVTGSMVVCVMMSLNLGNITVLFVNHMSRFWGNGTSAEIKANKNAATIILVCPILPGLVALWVQLNTIPAFYASHKAIQFDTFTKRLLHWIYRSVCHYRFNNSTYLQIKNVMNLSMLAIAVGLLITQPDSLNNGILVLTTISYFAAKPLAMIPSLFQNYVGRRLGSGENKLRNSEFPSNSSSQPPGSSTEMKIISSQESDLNNNDNRFKLFLPKSDFENDYNDDINKKSKSIALGNSIEYNTFN